MGGEFLAFCKGNTNTNGPIEVGLRAIILDIID